MSDLPIEDILKFESIQHCFADENREPAECDTEAEIHGLDRVGFGTGRAVYRIRNTEPWNTDLMDYSSVVKFARDDDRESPLNGHQQNKNEARMWSEIPQLHNHLGEVRAVGDDHGWIVMERKKTSVGSQSEREESLHEDIKFYGWKCKEVEEFGETWDGDVKAFDYGACFPEDEYPLN